MKNIAIQGLTVETKGCAHYLKSAAVPSEVWSIMPSDNGGHEAACGEYGLGVHADPFEAFMAVVRDMGERA